MHFEKGGWLIKQGHNVKNWKRRWFVLKDPTLAYYRAPKETKPQGIIILDDMEAIIPNDEIVKNQKGREVQFDTSPPPTDFWFVIKAKQKEYLIAAETEADMLDWIELLEQVIFVLSQKQNLNDISLSVLNTLHSSNTPDFVNTGKSDEKKSQMQYVDYPSSSSDQPTVEKALEKHVVKEEWESPYSPPQIQQLLTYYPPAPMSLVSSTDELTKQTPPKQTQSFLEEPSFTVPLYNVPKEVIMTTPSTSLENSSEQTPNTQKDTGNNGIVQAPVSEEKSKLSSLPHRISFEDFTVI